jgi:hypothetical protein
VWGSDVADSTADINDAEQRGVRLDGKGEPAWPSRTVPDTLTLAGRALQARGRWCLNRRLYQRRIQTDAAATQPYPRGYQQ